MAHPFPEWFQFKQMEPKTVSKKVVIPKNIVIINPAPDVNVDAMYMRHIFRIRIPEQRYVNPDRIRGSDYVYPTNVVVAPFQMLRKDVVQAFRSYPWMNRSKAFAVREAIISCQQAIRDNSYPHGKRGSKVSDQEFDFLPFNIYLESGQWHGLNRETTALPLFHRLDLIKRNIRALLCRFCRFPGSVGLLPHLIGLPPHFFAGLLSLEPDFLQLPLHQGTLPPHGVEGSLHQDSLQAHLHGLTVNANQRGYSYENSSDTGNREHNADPESSPVETILGRGRDDPYIGLNVLVAFGLEGWAVALLWNYGRCCWKGWLLCALSLCCFARLWISIETDQQRHQGDPKQFQHYGENVSQKLLTPSSFRITISKSRRAMANVLNTDKQIAIISALAEGSSIRSIERITGVHRDTIMRLGVKVGEGAPLS